MASSRAERMQRGYQAFSRGDVRRLAAAVTDDFEIHDHADPAYPVHRGRDAPQQLYARLHEVFREMTAEVEEVVERGDRVVVRVRFGGRGQASDAPAMQTMGHVWTFADDGSFAALHVYPNWDAALRAAGVERA